MHVDLPTGSSTLEASDRIVVFGEAHPDLAPGVRDWVMSAEEISSPS